MKTLGNYTFGGQKASVVENEIIKGGFFSKWCGQVAPQICVLPTEIQKRYLDPQSSEIIAGFSSTLLKQLTQAYHQLELQLTA